MAGSLHFSVRSERRGRAQWLTPVGELDIATGPILERAFEAVRGGADAATIVVDLGELSFIDASGFHLLERLTAACADADQLRLVNPSRAVERLLGITGSRAELLIVPHGADPLAPLPAPRM